MNYYSGAWSAEVSYTFYPISKTRTRWPTNSWPRWWTSPRTRRTEDAKFHDGNAFGRVAASGGNFVRGQRENIKKPPSCLCWFIALTSSIFLPQSLIIWVISQLSELDTIGRVGWSMRIIRMILRMMINLTWLQPWKLWQNRALRINILSEPVIIQVWFEQQNLGLRPLQSNMEPKNTCNVQEAFILQTPVLEVQNHLFSVLLPWHIAPFLSSPKGSGN